MNRLQDGMPWSRARPRAWVWRSPKPSTGRGRRVLLIDDNGDAATAAAKEMDTPWGSRRGEKRWMWPTRRKCRLSFER